MGAPMGLLAQEVTSFTLVDASTGSDIATYPPGVSATVSRLQYPSINVRANTVNTRSVIFNSRLGGRIENTAPFAFWGDVSSRYLSWAPSVGTFVIEAKPFSQANKAGQVGEVARLHLVITAAPASDLASASAAAVALGQSGKPRMDP